MAGGLNSRVFNRVKSTVGLSLIEPLSTIFLLGLINHYSNHDYHYKSENYKKANEELLCPRHAWSRIILVLPWRTYNKISFWQNIWSFLFRHPGNSIQLISFNAKNILSITKISSSGKQSKEVSGWKFDFLDTKTGGLGSFILKIMGHSQLVILISDCYPSFMLHVPELYLTTSKHGVCSIPVMIVRNGPIVNHD